jgi:hypothetical protein
VLALPVVVGCRSVGDAARDGSVQDAAIETPEAAAPPAAPATTVGEWERETAPYVGLRIAIDDSGVGKVTRPSTNDPKNPELACQASLWKAGDAYLQNGSVVVRDWGVVGGRCEHRDTRATTTIALADGGGTLVMSVKRGKTTDQTWSRVAP